MYEMGRKIRKGKKTTTQNAGGNKRYLNVCINCENVKPRQTGKKLLTANQKKKTRKISGNVNTN